MCLVINQSPLRQVPVHLHALTGRRHRELFFQSGVQCKTCHNKPIDASLSLGWWIDSDSDHDEVEPSVNVRSKEKSASNVSGKSLKSGK